MANTLCVGRQMHLLLIVRSGDTIVLDVNLAFICKMAFKFVCFFFFFSLLHSHSMRVCVWYILVYERYILVCHVCSARHYVRVSSPGLLWVKVRTNSGSRGRGWEGRGWPRLGITPEAQKTDWVQRQRSSIDPLHRFQSDRRSRDQE